MLTVSDVVTLQEIRKQALWMQALADLVVSHSDRDVIRAFASRIIDDYKAQQVAAEQLAKSVNLVLQKELDSTDQGKLRAVGQRYKGSFDRLFVRDMAQPMPEGFRRCLETAYRKGITADVQALARKSLSLYEQYRQQARDMIHSQ